MDIISQASFQIVDWELSHQVFSEALEFQTIVHNHTFSKYRMDSHAQIITATKGDTYDSKPDSISLIISVEKIQKAARILAEAKANFVYRDDIGGGILATLLWSMDNGSSLYLESFAPDYWHAE
jgi:hypothetical protein